MSRYFQGLNNIKKIILIALCLRLFLVPWSYHSDLTTNEIWGIYAQEFGLRGFYDWLNFGNYARPDYPPLAMLLFLVLRWFYLLIFEVFWKLNINFDAFPSDFITWFDVYGYRSILKLPGIFADVGIGLAIYYWIKKIKNIKTAKYSMGLYLFNPVTIYLSGSWGQLDSAVSLFGLLAVVFAMQKKFLFSLISIFISVMIKATFIPLVPILIILSIKNKISPKTVFRLIIVLVALLWILGSLFIDSHYLSWIVNMYVNKILPGAVTLPFINLNSFNFWGLVLGLERIAVTNTYLGITLGRIAWIIGGGVVILIIRKFIFNAETFMTIIMLYFSIFMFFPRVHERYLFPIFVFFPLVLVNKPKLRKLYTILSLVFLVNLYHWWWFPEVKALTIFFDYELTERFFSFLNLVIFVKFLRIYYEEA
ncbi:MAG: hypothetical protein UV74_C0013G0377 [Candidatus Woesebacteria bacterium GW2011_GWB1_43_14]|uniref:Mannosyltransferase n=1 Tax=Candidatus Woesebacteria bacterium GW2011_GWB1_43_14 TaxID=1618578 RepID=A0A0G1DHB7_9BACT|nr:MAG: hypothetical protein UT21_C0001G0087 [Candidatus Woesebacteria bacterium GW2011_GWA1_39_11b]KKS78327.1 MAG: hypothetical protein UV51_C0001G0043 [Candidatus Woesebacteria bacterium GW2011_GWC1_42_9]KKS97255.1 MAG: hypothetical protein UV74_C0013G0377 [Candidatus Woesebacteria bacterium GW2011_GWB1_43_14]